MNHARLDRAQQLIEFKRFSEAQKEIRSVLAEDPNNATALSLLAICLVEENKNDEALKVIQNAVSIDPSNDYLLYLMGWIYHQQNENRKAERAVRNAIAFNPYHADYFGFLSVVQISLKEWQLALEAADQGLAIDPENLQCLNARSTALIKLDKKEEAYKTVQEALHHDPENDVTHANLAWGLLEKNDHKKALVHFREALRLNPESEFAKAGMIEAMKARYWFYRIFLKYAFWISNMKGTMQWVILLGLYFGSRIVQKVSDANPELSVYLDPLVYLYVAFAISTWVITPLANLFLRINVYGRYALNRDQIISSNFVGISLGLALISFLVFIPTQWLFLFFATFVFVLMMIPLGSMFKVKTGTGKLILMGAPVLLGLIGLAAIGQAFQSGEGHLFTIFCYGVLAYQFIANGLVIKNQ